MIKFTKIEASFEPLEGLGFKEMKVFEYKSDKNIEEMLPEVLKAEIFFETQTLVDSRGAKPKPYQVRTNHAFTDKVEITDFAKLTFDELETRIKTIEKEEDWGEDLRIFRTLMNQSKQWIVENNHQEDEIYFIYADEIPEEKLIEFNYCGYFMSIIILSDSKVVIFNHGAD
jgi:hypothetical protein